VVSDRLGYAVSWFAYKGCKHVSVGSQSYEEDRYVIGLVSGAYMRVVAIPIPSTSAQPTQSQQASVATAPTQPGPSIQGLSACLPLAPPGGAWRIPPPDPDDDDVALRTHQPQEGSHPAASDKPTHEWSREYLGQWCTTHQSETSSDTLDSRSRAQRLIPSDDLYWRLKCWSSG
jgi:hypothetical protein